jgi:hypothetical protein
MGISRSLLNPVRRIQSTHLSAQRALKAIADFPPLLPSSGPYPTCLDKHQTRPDPGQLEAGAVQVYG